jgi:hypothetical protein
MVKTKNISDFFYPRLKPGANEASLIPALAILKTEVIHNKK